jgi:hypothetical protein
MMFRSFGRVRLVVGMAAVLLAVTSFVAVSASASASPKKFVPPKGLGHFLCYVANVGPAGGFQIPSGVVLQNQFNTTGFQPTLSQAPLLHCNPVQKTVVSTTKKKTVYKIVNPHAHLLCFPITKVPTQVTFNAQVTNQFGSATLQTGQPNDLCLPTWKSLTGPPNKTPNQPPGLDHFTCYPVTYVPGTKPFQPPATVLLKDQFTSKNISVQVGAPELLCLPTTKTVGGVTYRAKNTSAHLLCFEVSQTPFPKVAWDENQFGTAQIAFSETSLLCLPSTKKVLSSSFRR